MNIFKKIILFLKKISFNLKCIIQVLKKRHSGDSAKSEAKKENSGDIAKSEGNKPNSRDWAKSQGNKPNSGDGAKSEPKSKAKKKEKHNKQPSHSTSENYTYINEDNLVQPSVLLQRVNLMKYKLYEPGNTIPLGSAKGSSGRCTHIFIEYYF